MSSAERQIEPMRHDSLRTLLRHGKACAQPFVKGIKRASQCHHITK
ncbi:hypothetical protein [Streptomyces sp. NPDC003522]